MVLEMKNKRRGERLLETGLLVVEEGDPLEPCLDDGEQGRAWAMNNVI
jgi:hypothetical protein